MDWTIIAPILAGVGALFGAYGTIQGQRVANVNKRFEMLFTYQGRDLERVMNENDDYRTRIRLAETAIAQCEKDKHKQTLEIIDLQHTRDQQGQEITLLKRKVTELRELIPNGTALD